MPQSHLSKALAKLKTPSAKDPSGKPLDELESLFECSRSYQGNFRQFLEELVQTAFWESQSYHANPYPMLCIELAALIDSHNELLGFSEPAYHSRKHFQDVCLALTALLDQPIKCVQKSDFDDLWEISNEESWVLLFCAIAHDFGHDGSTNKTPFELEKSSIEKTRTFLSQSGAVPSLIQGLQAQIEPIILATDPSFLGSLLAKFNAPSAKPTKTDCLCMLMVESDLLASALPIRGKMLGKLLGQEWHSSNPKAAATVASDQGRLKFLEYIRFTSPHAIMLNMEDIRNHSIKQLKD
jgi:hypothetical protein